MRRTYVAVLLLALVLAGCTALPGGESEKEETVPTTPNDGLTVTFSPTLSSFAENQVLQFTVGVANTGQSDATAIKASAYGNPFTQPKRCRQALWKQGGGGLIPAALEKDAPPEETDNWQCAPPAAQPGYSTNTQISEQLVDLTSGASDTYTAGLQVLYNYTTTAKTRLTVTTPSQITGKTPVTLDNDAAPVKARINMQEPVSQQGTINIPIMIENVGDGKPVPQQKFNGREVKLVVTGPAGTTTVTKNLIDSTRQVVVSLDGFTLPSGTANVEKEFPIEVTLHYRYRERISRPFTVAGQPSNVALETFG